MSDENENKTSTGKGLLESLRGETASSSGSLEVSDTFPSRVSFESERKGKRKLSVSYGRIDSLRWDGQEIAIRCGDCRITLTGVLLEDIYEALNQQKAIRIIEQPEQGDDDEDPTSAYVDNSTWDREFD